MVRKQTTKAWYQTLLLPLDGIRKEIEIQRAHFFLNDAVIIAHIQKTELPLIRAH